MVVAPLGSIKVCEGVDTEDLKTRDAIRFELLTEDEEEGSQNLDNEEEGQILFTPPAVSNADSFNVLKFYLLSDEVLQSLRTFQSNWNSPQGQHKQASSSGAPLPEFPFIPDEREDSIINSNMNCSGSHSSILLVGRSGTGKTSIAVGRMWALYKHCHSESWHGGHYNQVFVTANRVLRDQVRKSFQGMKHGFTGVQEGVSEYPHTLRDVPEGMFPLFLTQGEFLKMLDGTLAKPFWPRAEDGSLQQPVDNAFHEEAGMLDEIPDEDFEYFSDNPDDVHGQIDAEPLAPAASAEVDKRVEIDFEVSLFSLLFPLQRRGLCRKPGDAVGRAASGARCVPGLAVSCPTPAEPLPHGAVITAPRWHGRRRGASARRRAGRRQPDVKER